MPRTRSLAELETVFALKAEGRIDREISLLTGVPVNTIRLWRNRRRLPAYATVSKADVKPAGPTNIRSIRCERKHTRTS